MRLEKKLEKQRHNQIIYERNILGIKDFKTNWFAGFGRGCMSGKDLPFPRPGRMEVLGLLQSLQQLGILGSQVFCDRDSGLLQLESLYYTELRNGPPYCVFTLIAVM
jgi:hypothetical protein